MGQRVCGKTKRHLEPTPRCHLLLSLVGASVHNIKYLACCQQKRIQIGYKILKTAIDGLYRILTLISY